MLLFRNTNPSTIRFKNKNVSAVYYRNTKIWPSNTNTVVNFSNLSALWLVANHVDYFDIEKTSSQITITNDTGSMPENWEDYSLHIVCSELINFNSFKTITIQGRSDWNGPFHSITPQNYANAYMNRNYPSGTMTECEKVATSMIASNPNSTYGNTYTIILQSSLTGSGYIFLILPIASHSKRDYINSIVFSS